jgi:uncharacterized protein YcaQ
MLQELLYEDRKLIDYPDKELSIWPAEGWPYFSSYRERSLELGRTFDGLEELKEQAIAYIDENGPVSSDMLPIEGEIYWHSSMHWSGNWDKNSTAFLGLNINAEMRKKILARLTDEGKIRPVMVEGMKTTFYYLSSDDALMKKIIEGSADLKPRMSFIAPLDPLMWDKSLVLALWDFQYSWEIYTPAVKRKYGYYTLPILFGEKFVGRIEAIPDRKNKILSVKGLWWEPGIRKTKKLDAALLSTLKAFSKFNDCVFDEVVT